MSWLKCTDCGGDTYSNYGSDAEPVCGECHLKRREAKRQALWDASSQRNIDLTGQMLWQRVTEADDWDANDDAVGQVWERVVILESKVSWYDTSSRIIVAYFRLGSGVKIYALGQRKQKGVPTLSEATQKRLHQAMIAWYADTMTASGICVDCGVMTADDAVRCPHCQLEQEYPLPEPEVIQTDEEIASADRDEIPW